MKAVLDACVLYPTVLREILQRYELTMTERKPERTRIRNITCVPKGKARVVVTAR